MDFFPKIRENPRTFPAAQGRDYLPHNLPLDPPEQSPHTDIRPFQRLREGAIHLYQLVEGVSAQVGEEFGALGVRFAGADDAGVTGDGVFDLGVALGDLARNGLKQSLTMFSIQQNDGCSLVIVHFGVILGYTPVVAQGDVGDTGQLAVMAIIARCILANAAQEQAHVFRAAMMHRNGFPGPETGRSSLGDTDHYPAVIQDAFRQDGEDSATGRLQTDRLVLHVGGHHFQHRAFPAAQGRALAARSRGVTPRLPRLEGRVRDTSGPPGPSGFDLP